MIEDYNLISQEKNNYCICSVLQAIFDTHNINISQKDIASKLTPDGKGFCIDDNNIKKLLRNKGFEYKHYWRNQVLFNEIEFALDELQEVQGFIGIGKHAYLFIKYDEPEITLIDPENGKTIIKKCALLDKEMCESKNGFFGLIKKL